jgi:hypothetical protein
MIKDQMMKITERRLFMRMTCRQWIITYAFFVIKSLIFSSIIGNKLIEGFISLITVCIKVFRQEGSFNSHSRVESKKINKIKQVKSDSSLLCLYYYIIYILIIVHLTLIPIKIDK